MEIYKNNVTLEDIIAAQEEANKKHFPINGDAYTLFLMGVYVEKVGESNEEDIDDTFNKCTSYLNEFLHSKFNNTNKSLIECINEYMEWRLEQNKKDAYKNKLSTIDDKIRLLQMEATCKNNELKNRKNEVDALYQKRYEDIRKFLFPIMEKVYKLREFSREISITLPAFEIQFETCQITFPESGVKQIGYHRASNGRYFWKTWLHLEYDTIHQNDNFFLLEFIKNWKEENKVIVTNALDAYVDSAFKTIDDSLAVRKVNIMAEKEKLEGGEF